MFNFELQQSQHLWHQLAMFFRDELLSWSWRRPLGMPLGPVPGGGSLNPIDFKHKITANVEQVIGRISGIAPQYLSEEVSGGVRRCSKSSFTEMILLNICVCLFDCLYWFVGGECCGPTAFGPEGCDRDG